jgi:hypothetical protein
VVEPELEPTPPAACGLALALPMDFTAIERAIAGGPYADYIGRAGSIGSAGSIWEHGFQRVAGAAATLAREAAAVGALVATNATLADLRRLFDRCTVVTIVAHWRGAEIDASDILLDPGLIADRLERELSPIADLIRTGLAPEWKQKVLGAGRSAAQSSLLAEILDRRMRVAPPLVPAPQDVEWHMDAATLYHANRAALDDWWPQAFAPGNRLELADGLHPPTNIAACVPAAWSGVADLSNCQSAQFIDRIKQARSDRLVIANERGTNPLRRMALIRVIYEYLAKGSRNYAEVRVALAEAMMAERGC